MKRTREVLRCGAREAGGGLSTAIRAGKKRAHCQTPGLSVRHDPSHIQGMHASRAHLPRAPTRRRWADPGLSQAHKQLAHAPKTADCSLKSGRWRMRRQTVGGALEGMSIRPAKAGRGHVPKTAASESGSLIGTHTPGCPDAAGESEGCGGKQKQGTGGNGVTVSGHHSRYGTEPPPPKAGVESGAWEANRAPLSDLGAIAILAVFQIAWMPISCSH